MNPEISIITPSFRQPQWLRLCLASVADQQEVRVEHIVQDAESGPEVHAVVADFSDAQLVVEKDFGMYDAVNRGLRRAKAPICAYLNCDEQYLQGALRRVVKWFDANPEVDVLFGDAVIVNAAGEPLCYRQVVAPTRMHTRLRFAGTLTCSMFFRRRLVEEGLWFDASYRDNGDAVWVHSVLAAGKRIGVLNEPLAIFTHTGANMSLGENPAKEYARWNAQSDAPPAFLKVPVRLAHTLRKLLAGAYRSRAVKLAIYTAGNPHRRVHQPLVTLGTAWPKA